MNRKISKKAQRERSSGMLVRKDSSTPSSQNKCRYPANTPMGLRPSMSIFVVSLCLWYTFPYFVNPSSSSHLRIYKRVSSLHQHTATYTQRFFPVNFPTKLFSPEDLDRGATGRAIFALTEWDERGRLGEMGMILARFLLLKSHCCTREPL